MRLIYTVNPGIEDLAASEAQRLIGGRVEYTMFSGRVYHEVPGEVAWEDINRLSMINRAYILLWRGEIGGSYASLTQLYDQLPNAIDGLAAYLTPLTSYAVTVERVGSHEYTSLDIARIVGDVAGLIVERVHGKRPPVNLKHPSLVIHVLVVDREISIGVSVTGKTSRHRRFYRILDHPAALKPVLARAMLMLAGTRDKNIIMDPMCGGGTIPIEAAFIHEDAEIYCIDRNPRYLRKALMNAAAARVDKRVVFIKHDATRLGELGVEPDYIVTNPPYGIRFGNPGFIRRLYSSFIAEASRVLPEGGRLTMITTEYTYARREALRNNLAVIHERTVYHGNLYPHILVLEKR